MTGGFFDARFFLSIFIPKHKEIPKFAKRIYLQWIVDCLLSLKTFIWTKINQQAASSNINHIYCQICMTHSKIGGLFMFQKVPIQMLPIYVYLPFQKVKLCTHMNNPLILIQNTLDSGYFRILHIIDPKS